MKKLKVICALIGVFSTAVFLGLLLFGKEFNEPMVRLFLALMCLSFTIYLGAHALSRSLERNDSVKKKKPDSA